MNFYLYVEALPSALPEFGIGGQSPPHAIPEKMNREGTIYVSLELNCTESGVKSISKPLQLTYRRRQRVSSEAAAFMKRQTSAHEMRSSEERNLKICRNSSGGMLLNSPVSI